MAYLGVDPNLGDITFQTFTGDGNATAFTLGQTVVSGEAILVTIGNVVGTGVSQSIHSTGTTLTFSAAPANGDVITVRFFGRAVDMPTATPCSCTSLLPRQTRQRSRVTMLTAHYWRSLGQM